MAAIIATIKGKVLIQLPGSEPVEVGEVEIPIHASTSAMPKTRGGEVTIAARTVHADHACTPCTECEHSDHCSLNCPRAAEAAILAANRKALEYELSRDLRGRPRNVIEDA